MKILFSGRKLFDKDEVYNVLNHRIWAVSRVEADKRDGVKQKRKFPEKVMVWLAACFKRVSPILIFDEGTIDYAQYIREVLPVTQIWKRHPGKIYWTFQ